jgi:hypothetical protein
MMKTSAMAMPWGMARRTSQRALTWMGDPSAEVPAPAARLGRRQSVCSRVEAVGIFCVMHGYLVMISERYVWDMQTICICYLGEQLGILGWLFVKTLYCNLSLPYRVNVFQQRRCPARRKIPLRMSWCSVSCGARAEQRMAWSKSVWRRAAPQQHCTAGGFGGSMVRQRWCRKPVSALELQSSRERECDQPSRGPTAGAAKTACAGELAPVCAGVIGVHQSIGTELGRTPGNCALHGGDGAQAVGIGLMGIRSPQISGSIM